MEHLADVLAVLFFFFSSSSFFFFFLLILILVYNFIVPVGFLLWEIQVAFHWESLLRQSRATQPTVHFVCFIVSIIHQTFFSSSYFVFNFSLRRHCPIGISPTGNSDRFSPGKACCDRVALPNQKRMLGVFCFHNLPNSDMDYRIFN